MLDWLIIGGGIHGTYLSHVLTAQGGVPRDRLRVLDPHVKPLARWDACTENVGMAYLRSSFVHHLGIEPYALRAFAKERQLRDKKAFLGKYLRPSLRIFREHTQQIIEENKLDALRLRGQALALVAHSRGMRVETEQGALEAKRVLLAIGMGDLPEIPEFAIRLRRAGKYVPHVFDAGFSREELPTFQHAVVVGAGISAAQTALALAQRPSVQVTLVSRHPLRIQSFDTDPGWMGPKNLRAFARVTDYDERRRIVASARFVGSMPDDVATALRKAISKGLIQHHLVDSIQESVDQGRIHLDFGAGKPALDADVVVLATGFQKRRPGGQWLEKAIADLGLQCASCGFPIVDARLQWHPGVFVSGPLAELELGPPARNILGARMAGERILRS